VDLGVFGVVEVASAVEVSDGDDVVALGAGVVEAPRFFGGGGGVEGFHFADGGEFGDHSLGEAVMGDAVFVGHDGDLGGEGVAAGVLGGTGFAGFSARAGGFGGVRAVGGEALGGDGFGGGHDDWLLEGVVAWV